MESIAIPLSKEKMIISEGLYNILIIDEDPNSPGRKFLETYPAYSIFHVTNQQDAEKALAEKKWDLALLDYYFEKNKENNILSSLLASGKPFIVLTENSEPEVDLELLKMGVPAYFTERNLNGEQLERTVRFAIENKKIAINKNKEEAEKRTADKLNTISHIARTVAHEVRNPLTNVNLSLEQLKNEITNKDESLDMYFDIIARNCERINTLITELLNATKPASIEPSLYSLNEITDQAISMAEDKLKGKEVKIEKEFSKDKLEVSVDSNKVKQAIFNIISNSVDSVEDKKGIIKIKTFSKKNKSILQIVDNGPGITKENLSKIFDPFFSGRAHSMGLGLTAAQNIILNHKGKIEVESEEGTGTRVTITL